MFENLYKFIFLSLASTLDLELNKNKSKRWRKPLINNNEIYYNELMGLLSEGKKWMNLKNVINYIVYFTPFNISNADFYN